MLSALVQGFWLGLAAGPQCFAACAPIVLPLLCAEGGPGLVPAAGLLGRFLAGRLAAYLLVGAAAGAAGSRLGAAPDWLAAAALAATGGLLLAYAWAGGFPGHRLCAAVSRRLTPRSAPLALGLLTGANICPPFVAGLTAVLSLGSGAAGAIFFAAFFAATSLYLLPALGVCPWLSSPRARLAGRAGLMVAGAWYLAAAVRLAGY